jgi:hypothetical protein
MLNRVRARLRSYGVAGGQPPPPPQPYQPPLDTIATTSGYALRKLRTAYSGAAIRVRRSSDSVEQDIGFTSVGSDIVTNGSFATDTFWSKGAGVTISGGVVNASSASQIVWDFTCSSGSGIRINNASTNGANPKYVRNGVSALSGKVECSFVANNGFISLEAEAVNFTGTIDNLVVRRLTAGGFDLDIGALVSFITPSGSLQSGLSSGFVTTWYDQSGNGIHATQPTATIQPRIVNAGVIDRLKQQPAIRFLGAQRLMATSGLVTTTEHYLNLVNVNESVIEGRAIDIRRSDNPTPLINFPCSTGIIYSRVRNDANVSHETSYTATLTIPLVMSSLSNSGSFTLFTNGIARQSSPVAGNLTFDRFGIGANVGGGFEGNNPYIGAMSEIVYANYSVSTADRQTLEAGQVTYYGITVV